MKKVVIADDDAAMRISLKTMLDWGAYGYRIAGEAADGREALELCLREKPEIVITDMKMPGTDGIAFLKELRASKLAPHIIVLSGYDDFSLVRDAMKLGASDYILKLELDREKLLDLLSAASGKEQDAEEEQEEDGRGGIDRALLQQHLLREVICHFYEDAGACMRSMAEAGISFPSGRVYCFLVKAGELYRFEEADDEEAHTLQNAVRNVAEDILHDCMEGYYIPGKTGELFVFASLKEAYAAMEELPFRLAGRMREMLYQFLDITCTICVSAGGNTPDELYGSARQVQELMKQRFCFEENGVLRCDRLPVKKSRSAEWGYNLPNRLAAAVADFDAAAVREVFTEAEELMELLSPDEGLEVMLALYSASREMTERYGQEIRNMFAESFLPLSGFILLKSIGDRRHWLEALMRDLLVFLEGRRLEAGPKSTVEAACRLLEESYAEELSLPLVADRLGISPGYLSAMMKKQVGRGFTDYLNGVRIAHAKKLLTETNGTLHAIASEVGYTDQYYFSRLFKKMTGVSPGSWRRGERAEE